MKLENNVSHYPGCADDLMTQVTNGTLDRRSVLKRGIALGLSAPVIAGLLAACGGGDDDETINPTSTTATGADDEPTAEPDDAPPVGDDDDPDSTPTGGQRGGGGEIRLFYWQAPVILNPHYAQGGKDWDASRVCLEPLFEFDDDLNPIFYLADEPYPSVENGMLAEDGTWVQWNLRQGVKWHDGEDFNAEDVKFTYDWIMSEGNTATTYGVYENVESVEVIDDYTVQVNFRQPDPVWYDPFRARNGLILPEHIFRDHMGEAGRDAPANLMPVGTGPFKVVDFRPGDLVYYELFDEYWEEGKPHFDSVELKGGGDAASAARAVLQTGEADWAWNLVVEPQVLDHLVSDGQTGQLSITPGVSSERIIVNSADPRTEVDGAYSEPSTTHPLLSDIRIRQALDYTIPRDVIREQLFGEGDIATAQYIQAPEQFSSPNISYEYDPERAQELLDEAGFDGAELLFQTTTSPTRQRVQEILKEEWERLGFSVELKAIEPSVYFSSDAGNPDTISHFYADLEMYNTEPQSPMPLSHMRRWHTDEIAQQSNSWSGANFTRYSNPDVDAWIDELASTIDEERQIELVHLITEKVREDLVEMTLVAQSTQAAISNRIGGHTNYVWQSNPMPVLKDWYLKEE